MTPDQPMNPGPVPTPEDFPLKLVDALRDFILAHGLETVEVGRHARCLVKFRLDDRYFGLYASAIERDTVLTPRQSEIARCLAEGVSREQIAVRLGITKYTVDSHVRRIYEKLDIRSGAELARKLFEF
jgi:DNA-binding NarL/FixJ family response regulator